MALLLIAYTAVSWQQHLYRPLDTTIPSWGQIAQGVVKMVEAHPRSGERWLLMDAWATGVRLFLGLAIGVAAAVALGMLMGNHRGVEAFFLPSLSLLAKIPPTAALAVFFVLAGTKLTMHLSMIAFGILPSLAMSVYLAARDVPEELIDKAITLGASNNEVVWSLVFRHVLPKIIDSVRLQVGPAMVYLIAAESICADAGFGYRIRLQSKLLDMSVVYPYLALLAAFGFGMDFGLRGLSRWLCPWARED